MNSYMRIVALVSAVGISFGVAACGRGEAGAGAGSEPVIGLSSRFIAEVPFLASMVEEAVAEGGKRGYRVEVTNAGGDAARQIQQLQNYISMGVEAIVVEPVDDQGIATGIQAAERAGIPVIVVNDQVTEDLAKQVACNVRDDSIAIAAGLGRKVAETVDKRVPPNEKVTLYIQAIYPQELLTETRENGFMQGWNEYFQGREDRFVRVPNVYGEAKPELTLEAMRSTVNAHPDIDAIFNQTDTVWGAVRQALTEANLMTQSGESEVVIAGFDANMEIVQQMAEEPTFPIVAVGANEPRTQAIVAVEEAIAASNGETTGACEGSPPTRLLDPVVVTKENAADFVDPESPFAYGEAGRN